MISNRVARGDAGDQTAPNPPAASDATLQRALARLAGLRTLDLLIARGTDPAELAAAALRHLRSLVPAGRATVILYDQAARTGTLLAVDEASPIPAAAAGTLFPLEALVPAEFLAAPATRVYPDIERELAGLVASEIMLANGYRAALWAPMVVDGALLGVIAMAARVPGALAGDAVDVADEVAALVATGLRAIADRVSAARSAERLEMLHQVDRAILAAERPEDIAARAVEHLRRLAGADRVTVARFDLERRTSTVLAFAQAAADGGYPAGTVHALDAVVGPEILERREVVIHRDLAALVPVWPAARDAVEHGVRAAVVVPLVAGDQLVGVLSLGGHDLDVASDDNVSIAREVAAQLALAIVHATAKESAETAAGRLALVHDIDKAILASESREELAARVADPLARLAGARRLDIAAYDLERDEGQILAFAHDGTSRATPVGLTFPLRQLVPMVELERPETLVLDDLPAHLSSVPVLASSVAAGLTRAAWIPLLAGDRLLGAIGMAGDDPAMTSAETVGLARAMGDQLAVAFQHAADRAALAEREARLRVILEASPNGILAIDPAGTISYANPAAHRLFAAPDGALDGLSLGALVPPPAAASHPVLLEGWFGDSTAPPSHPLNTEARRLDGTTFPVHVLIAPIETPNGRLAITTVVDLSERTALQARLRQAERLQVLGQFAGILAHDVRNYLSAIAWSADVLATDLPDDDPHQEDVALIHKATQDAVDMTRSVLEFARPTGDPRGSTDVAAHITGARAMLRRVLRDRVSLELDLEPGLPPARINKTALTQVLGNLATNARDAMPDGGTFRVAAHLHAITSAADPETAVLEPGRYVRLVVSDTGDGMDDETRERAFEAFFTTKTMASTARGTGLGLSSVFLIVTRAGGSVRVDSAPGAGTTFTLDLPALG